MTPDDIALDRATAPGRADRYRNALMWVFDRMTVDGGMTAREQLRTAKEIGRVLSDLPSEAATYQPNDWDDSAKLTPSGFQQGKDHEQR